MAQLTLHQVIPTWRQRRQGVALERLLVPGKEIDGVEAKYLIRFRRV